MRGVDTNVLARYFTADDPRQYAQASTFLAAAEDRAESLYVTHIALCELIWVLRGRGYGFDRERLADLLVHILDNRTFVLEARDRVQAALADYRTGKGDFADYLMHRVHQTAGCRDTVTFDGDLEPDRGFTRLGEDEYPPFAPGSDLVMEGDP